VIKRSSGVVALEFLFVFPLLVGLLYAGLVYGLLFFHKLEMQRAVDMAATSVFSLDRRQHQNYSEDVLEHSKEALAKLVGNLPAPLQSRLNEQVCENVALEGIALLECRLTADGTSPFLPQLSLGFMGTFPPQPSELSVKAAVAF